MTRATLPLRVAEKLRDEAAACLSESYKVDDRRSNELVVAGRELYRLVWELTHPCGSEVG